MDGVRIVEPIVPWRVSCAQAREYPITPVQSEWEYERIKDGGDR